MLSREGYLSLLDEIKREFPDFVITKKKSSALMKAADAALKILTFGSLSNFMDGFITTVGSTVYVPDAWDVYSPSSKAITLRHERVHMRQAKEKGKLAFTVSYLFLPVPFIFARSRMKFEQEAYEESLKAYNEYYGPKFFTPALKDNIVNHFITSEYFWMWPWKNQIEEWYDAAVSKILKI
jgi:hypothetical protein